MAFLRILTHNYRHDKVWLDLSFCFEDKMAVHMSWVALLLLGY